MRLMYSALKKRYCISEGKISKKPFYTAFKKCYCISEGKISNKPMYSALKNVIVSLSGK